MSNTFSLATLNRIAYDNNIPKSVTIELLTKCNLKCKHCYIPEHVDNGLDTKEIINLLHELREAGTFDITLTGGEIFLRKDIFEIIEEARKLHFRVFLLSNASILNEEQIKRLANLHISEFSTSVYSLDSAIHDSITTVPGSLERTLNNILLMKKYNIFVEVKTPLMNENRFAYKELHEFCKKHNFRYAASPIITAKINGNTSPYSLRIEEDDLLSIMSDLNKITSESEKLTEEMTKKSFDSNGDPCPIIRFTSYVDSKGNVHPCNSFIYTFGNILEHKFSDIWNDSEKFKQIKSIKKKDLKKCAECELKDDCNRCPGLALLEDGDLFGCSTLAKNIATVNHKLQLVK